MVAVGMGDDQVGDALARVQPVDDGVDMVLIVRAGIYHCDFAPSDDVGTGPVIGVRARVVGHDPPDGRRERLDLAVGDLRFGYKGNGGHTHVPRPSRVLDTEPAPAGSSDRILPASSIGTTALSFFRNRL